jgi:hypothetical protein
MISAGKMLKGAIASAPTAPLKNATACRAQPCDSITLCDSASAGFRHGALSERAEIDMRAPRITRIRDLRANLRQKPAPEKFPRENRSAPISFARNWNSSDRGVSRRQAWHQAG